MYSHWLRDTAGQASFSTPVEKYRLRIEEDIYQPGRSDSSDIKDYRTEDGFDTLDVVLTQLVKPPFK